MSATPKKSQASLDQKKKDDLQEQDRLRQEALEREIQRSREEVRKRQEEEARQLYERRRQESLRLLRDAETTFEVIRKDRTITKWCRADLDNVAQIIEAARHAAITHAWGEVEQQAKQTQAQSEQIMKRARARQFQEMERSYVVSCLLTVLKQEHFIVARPSLLRANDYESDVVLRAVRNDQRALKIRVPTNGLVSYYPFSRADEQEIGWEQKDGHICRNFQKQIQVLHSKLRDHGLNMGKLTWDDQPEGPDIESEEHNEFRYAQPEETDDSVKE